MPHLENARRALVDAITRYGPILAIGEAGAANVLAHLDLEAGYLTIALVGGAFPEASLWTRRPISPSLRAASPAEQVSEARAYLAETLVDLHGMLSRAEGALRALDRPDDHLDIPSLVEGCEAAGLRVFTID